MTTKIELCGWFDSWVSPPRPGVYRISTTSPIIFYEAENRSKGWGYMTWTGKGWVTYGRWGGANYGTEFKWCGLTGTTKHSDWVVPA